MNMSILVYIWYKYMFLYIFFVYMCCWEVFYIVIGVFIDIYKFDLGV